MNKPLLLAIALTTVGTRAAFAGTWEPEQNPPIGAAAITNANAQLVGQTYPWGGAQLSDRDPNIPNDPDAVVEKHTTYEFQWVPNGTLAMDPAPAPPNWNHIYTIEQGPVEASKTGTGARATASATLQPYGTLSVDTVQGNPKTANAPTGGQTETGYGGTVIYRIVNGVNTVFFQVEASVSARSYAWGTARSGESASGKVNGISIRSKNVTLQP